MNTKMIFVCILISAAITFALRALPFVAFRGERKMPEKLVYLGKILPSAIIAVLIVYCLKDAVLDITGGGYIQFIAVLVVAVSYKLKHNTFLSIALGTACNILLLNLL